MLTVSAIATGAMLSRVMIVWYVQKYLTELYALYSSSHPREDGIWIHKYVTRSVQSSLISSVPASEFSF